jgi:hypothetical protein
MTQPSDSQQPQPSTAEYRAPGTPDPLPQLPSIAPAPIVALFGWILPGGGYFLIGEPARGIVICVTILALFFAGLLIAGVRVIDVPGYDDAGRKVFVYLRRPWPNRPDVIEVRNTTGEGRWILRVHPVSEIGNKVWNVPQALAGPVYFVSAYFSIRVAQPDANTSPPTPGVPRTHGRLAEIGTLYLAVAGVLNLLAIIDASHRAGQLQHEHADRAAAAATAAPSTDNSALESAATA